MPSDLAVLRLIASSYFVGPAPAFGRLLAFENAIDIAGRVPELVGEISPVGDQAAGSAERAEDVDRGQPVLGRKRNDQIALSHRLTARCHDQAATARACEGRDTLLDVVQVDGVHLEPSDGATDWMTANWPIPAGMPGSQDRRSLHARPIRLSNSAISRSNYIRTP